jgi:hypothetical protein
MLLTEHLEGANIFHRASGGFSTGSRKLAAAGSFKIAPLGGSLRVERLDIPGL